MSTTWNWPESTCIRVIDGDTFVAQVSKDAGFHAIVTFQQRLRLNRINAPKKSTDAGKACLARVLELLQGTLNIDTVGAYKYGDEWMAEVTTANGLNVSDKLVKEGLAVYWNGTGSRPGDG